MNQSIQHSADVDIYLLLNGERIEVASCLGNRVMLRNPKDMPPCQGELVIVVDGVVRQKNIFLPHGLSKSKEHVEYETA